MMTSSFRRRVLATALVLFACPVFAFDQSKYAQSLEAESDWYRAIGVWKEVRFEAKNEWEFWSATEYILIDYWKARQFESGLREIVILENRHQTDQLQFRYALLAWKGLYQYQLSRFPEAEYSWRQADQRLYLGLLAKRFGHMSDVDQYWKDYPDLLSTRPPLIDGRDPLLAAAFSAVLPGLGQVYSSHWFDGAQALLFSGFFGFSTYATYLYDSKYSENYALTATSGAIALFFYAANVYGAVKTASFYNLNQQTSSSEYWESLVFSMSLPAFATTKPESESR